MSDFIVPDSSSEDATASDDFHRDSSTHSLTDSDSVGCLSDGDSSKSITVPEMTRVDDGNENRVKTRRMHAENQGTIIICLEVNVNDWFLKTLKKSTAVSDEDIGAGSISENSPAHPWWHEFISDEDLEDYKNGPKLILLFAILKQSEKLGDKV